jgi:hypothetical protein
VAATVASAAFVGLRASPRSRARWLVPFHSGCQISCHVYFCICGGRAWSLCALRSPEDPVQEEQDLLATAGAAYIVLLAAHGRGLVGYWRTPGS